MVISQSVCEPIMETIQSLAQQIEDIDYQIGALQAEALQLNLLQYFVSQRKIDHLVGVKQMLQDEWNNEMNALARCRSAQPAH